MTQTMRDKLQAFVNTFRHRLKSAEIADVACVIDKFDLAYLDSILATEPPAVTVRAGWVCKDMYGLWWCSQMPVWGGYGSWYRPDPDSRIEDAGDVITDPWPDHPNGGPECCMEVK